MLHSKGISRGVTLNVSSAGAFIHCPAPLRPSEVFLVVIEVSDLSRPLRAAAEVIWSSSYAQSNKPGLSGMGIRILTMSSKDRKHIGDAAIANLISKNHEDRGMQNGADGATSSSLTCKIDSQDLLPGGKPT
jgi:Tfp pilus assembly protein PilZ